MATWSKSEKAQIKRYFAAPRSVSHFTVPHFYSPFRKITACGRTYGADRSTLELSSTVLNTSCPRCIAALRKADQMTEVREWTVHRISKENPFDVEAGVDLDKTVLAPNKGDAIQLAIDLFDAGRDTKTLWVRVTK